MSKDIDVPVFPKSPPLQKIKHTVTNIPVYIKAGPLNGSYGIVESVDAHDDAPSWNVRLTDVSRAAKAKSYQIGEHVDLDRHELEILL